MRRPRAARGRPINKASAALESLRAHFPLVGVLFAAILVRLLLANWNSYWLDELYSVAIYGIWNDGVGDAIQTLADTSVHPPLYQFILYQWMSWFGDSEVATRTLSNVYITLAALLLYMALSRHFSKRMALASAVAFSLMNTAMTFGLETRSYAQTIFLATLSSYILLSMIPRSAEPLRIWSHKRWIALVLANSALLLTHYYNVFFVGAQAIVALAFALRILPVRRWLHGLGAVTILFGLPVLIFAGVWGRQFASTYQRMSRVYAVEESTQLRHPLDLLADLAASELWLPSGVMVVLLIVGVGLVARALVSIRRISQLNAETREAWTIAYLAGWLVLPLILSYLGFWLFGVARYSARYFLFSVIPLVPLILLALRHLWRSVRRVDGAGRLRFVRESATTALLMIIAVALFVPGAIEAATLRKTDWRGAARSIVAIAESNPESTYAILEPAFRRQPVVNYYLNQYSSELEAIGTLRRGAERAGGPFAFEIEPDLISDYDYLILPFVHHRVSSFPRTVRRLEELYPVHLKQIYRNGRGFIIWRLSDDA